MNKSIFNLFYFYQSTIHKVYTPNIELKESILKFILALHYIGMCVCFKYKTKPAKDWCLITNNQIKSILDKLLYKCHVPKAASIPLITPKNQTNSIVVLISFVVPLEEALDISILLRMGDYSIYKIQNTLPQISQVIITQQSNI